MEQLDRHSEITMHANQRLSKILAKSGVASRRKCEDLIRAGRVRINGKIAREMGISVDPSCDRIALDQRPINCASPALYYILHKPAKCVCSASGRGHKVLDLFQELPHRLFTVGRLDEETTGLLLVTNDGAFAHRVMHPRFGVVREYLVKTNVEISADHLRALSAGAQLDGAWIVPLRVQKVRRASVKIAVGEGKNREIRRLMQAHSLEVVQLTRIRIGHLTLGALPLGSWRAMTCAEREAAMAQHADLLARAPMGSIR